MELLKNVLADSWTVLMRNFTLIYPVLFIYLVIPLVAPREAMPDWEPRWVIMACLILLILFACLSGWLNMVCRACRHFILFEKPRLEREKEQAKNKDTFQPINTAEEPETAASNPLLNSFLLLREFFPGIGEYFVRFTLGGLLHVAVLAALYFAVRYGIDRMPLGVGLFEQFRNISASPEPSLAEMERFILGLSSEEQTQLLWIQNYVVLALISYGIFSLLVMFWPAFMMLQQRSVLSAYWQSVRQFFKDPVRIVLLGGMFWVVNMFGSFTMRFSGDILILSIWQIFTILWQVYFAVVLFMYVIQACGLPEGAAEAEAALLAEEAAAETRPV